MSAQNGYIYNCFHRGIINNWFCSAGDKKKKKKTIIKEDKIKIIYYLQIDILQFVHFLFWIYLYFIFAFLRIVITIMWNANFLIIKIIFHTSSLISIYFIFIITFFLFYGFFPFLFGEIFFAHIRNERKKINN